MCSLLIVFQFLLTQFANQFLGSNQLLLSGFHDFQGHFALVHFIFSNQCNKWNHLGIGITHLLLHFAGIGEYFGTNTCCPYSGEYIHRKSRLLLTKVDKQKLRTVHSFLRIQFQLFSTSNMRSAPNEIPTPETPAIPKTPVRLS